MLSDKITSTSNPLVKNLKALKTTSARQEQGLFPVEGDVMIQEALQSGLTPLYAFFEEDSDIAHLLDKVGAQVRLASRNVIESLCDTKTPQGSVCIFSLPDHGEIRGVPSFLCALDGVQDPGNLGTIIRTADAAGFDGLLLGEGCADPDSPKVQRAAMGSAFRMQIKKCLLTEELQILKKKGYKAVISALDGADLYENENTLPQKNLILVIGNEAKGVSPAVQVLADIRLKIPMRGKAESLNAAVAAGILMYELTKNR